MQPNTDLFEKILEKMLAEGHQSVPPGRFADLVADALALNISGNLANVRLHSRDESAYRRLGSLSAQARFFGIVQCLFGAVATVFFLYKIDLESDEASNSHFPFCATLFLLGTLYFVAEALSNAYDDDKFDLEMLERELQHAEDAYSRKTSLVGSDYATTQAAKEKLIAPAYRALRTQARGNLFSTVELNVNVAKVKEQYHKSR